MEQTPLTRRTDDATTADSVERRIDRRTVLGAGVTATIAAAGMLVPGGEAVAAPDAADHSRRPQPIPPGELDALTIPEIQRRFRSRRLTAVALTHAYLQRIESVDPLVGAVILVNPAAPHQAAESDRRRACGRSLGALDGIPVLLKDNIDTAFLQTTAGSRALLGMPPVHDAFIVTQLRRAGAVILGKANLSEWANFRADFATGGWSGVGGQTNNPYVLDRNPSGSSSGPAAGVAAALAQVAVGTETNGSIVSPSGQCGVVGMKPTLGIASRTGIVPISVEQDTAGPIARHVVDAAIVLAALRGADRRDTPTLHVPRSLPRDLAGALDGASLRDRRIGVWRQAGIDAGTDRVVQHAVDVLTSSGATVIEVEVDAGESGNLSFTALKSEFVRDLEAYLRTRPRQERTLQQLVDFNAADPVELSRFDQNLFLTCLAAPPASAKSIVAARKQAKALARAALDGLLHTHRLDAVMAPSNSPAWRTTYGTGDDFKIGSSGAAAVAGYPDLSVPAGYVGALPVGVNFIGGRWQDARILRIGAAFEAAARARTAPRFLPSIG